MSSKERDEIKDKLVKAIGNNIKIIREKAGDSQIEAAKKLGISSQSQGNYESGERIMDIVTLIMFCKKYNVDYSLLLDNIMEIRQEIEPIDFSKIIKE